MSSVVSTPGAIGGNRSATICPLRAPAASMRRHRTLETSAPHVSSPSRRLDPSDEHDSAVTPIQVRQYSHPHPLPARTTYLVVRSVVRHVGRRTLVLESFQPLEHRELSVVVRPVAQDPHEVRVVSLDVPCAPHGAPGLPAARVNLLGDGWDPLTQLA
jgi:hypothetical protein